ncbi:MAG: WG repeat-containing protein [Bacteroidales bacterium]|nr:WG repeat-containing protein [Bacteroidales bacterium]
MAEYYLKVRSDLDCEVWIDDEFITVAKKDKTEKIPLREGVYFVQLKNPTNNSFIVTYEKVKLIGYDDFLKPNFIELIESHPGLLRDEDLSFISDVRCFKNLLTGREITPHIYDNGSRFKEGFAVAGKGTQYGVINKLGQVIISTEYEWINILNKELFNVKKQGKWGLMNSSGTEILPCDYDYIHRISDGLIALSKNEQWGFVDVTGHEVIPIIYEEVSDFINGLAEVKSNNKWGCINKKGDTIIDFLYDFISLNELGYSVKRDSKWGLFDKKGKMVVPCIYDKLDIWGKYLVVSNASLCGVLDAEGNEIVPCKYDRIIIGKEEGFIAVKKNDMWGFFYGRREVTPCVYELRNYRFLSYYNQEDSAVRFESGLLTVGRDKKWGCINIQGEELIPCEYDKIEVFKDYVRVKRDGKYGLLDTSGTEFIPCIYDKVMNEYDELFYEGLTLVEQNGKYGFYNLKKQLVIPCIYDEYDDFKGKTYWRDIDDEGSYEEKLLRVKRNNKWGFINKQGKEVIPCIYENTDYFFSNGFLDVKYKGKAGRLDKNGKIIIPCDYKGISRFQDGVAKAINRGERKKGVKDYFEIERTDFFDKKGVKLHARRCVLYKQRIGCITWTSLPNKFNESDSEEVLYLFLDTETSGLPIDYDLPSSELNNWPRMIQLSWTLTYKDFSVVRSGDYIIKPEGFTIPISASRTNGITTEKATNEGLKIDLVLSEFLLDLEIANVVIGHNIDFDKKIIGAELIRIGKPDLIDGKKSICTMKESVNYCALPGRYGLKYPTLQELYKKLFGHSFNGSHNSANDVLATISCFRRMKEIGLL